MKSFFLSLILCFALCAQTVWANNIRMFDPAFPADKNKSSVPKLVGNADDASIPNPFYAIEFNLSWDNSWKSSNPRNWDAAWIFVKYNLGGTGWKHVWLADTNMGNPKHAIAASGKAKGASSGQKIGAVGFDNIDYTIVPGYSYVPEAGKSVPVGIFLHRSKNGYGTVLFEKLRLFWEYGRQGLASDDPVTVNVFAIEMVYVPDGEYYLGTGGPENNAFRVPYFVTNPLGNNFGTPFLMRREDSINIVQYPTTDAPCRGVDSTQLSVNGYTTTSANLLAQNAAVTRIRIPKEFPKGVAAYYVMKYEITQEAYIGYLNTLNIQQQGMRSKGSALLASDIGTQMGIYTKADNYRNGVTLFNLSGTATFVCNLTGAGTTAEDVNQIDDGQNIAMNYMRIADVLSYLAWSGLRPLTEFEYEKACRGNQLPVKGEYAWGNTTFNNCLNPSNSSGVNRPGFDNERPLSLAASPNIRPNCNLCPTTLATNTRPLRVGSFADSATTRTDAGASYWGIMNLTDNVTEDYVRATLETATMDFKGDHGYGELDPLHGGFPPMLSWPAVLDAAGNGITTSNYNFRGSGIGYYSTLGWSQGVNMGRVSDRYYIENTARATNATTYYTGGRGGRTAVSEK